MKSTLFICFLTWISISLTAQVPDAFKYQAVLRDNNGQIMENQTVTLRLSILQNTTEVYQETHAVTTNDYGLVSVNVGTGTVIYGNFSAIDWGTDIHYLQIDVNPGSGYIDMGTVQLLSVPYALYAAKADELSGGISETDPVFDTSAAAGISAPDISNWDEAYGWGDHSLAGYLTQEVQILSISNDTVYLTGGSFITLPAGFDGDYNSLTNKPDFTNWDTDVTDDFDGDYNSLTNKPDFTNWDTDVTDDFDGDFNSLQNIPASIWVPAGVISMFAGTTPPAGYLLCDGSEISRTTYANLFAVIGETYGAGDSSTTFNLPNFNGRIPVGYDSTQTEFDEISKTGGAKTHTLDISELPAHDHSGTTNLEGGHSHPATTSGAGGHTHPASTNAAGSVTPQGSISIAPHSHTASTLIAGSHTHSYSSIWWENSKQTYSPGDATSSSWAIPFVRNADGTTYNDNAYDDLRFYRSSDNAMTQPNDVDFISIGNSSANVPTWEINAGGTHTHNVVVNQTTASATFNGILGPPHTHEVNMQPAPNHNHSVAITAISDHSHTFNTTSTGGNAAHNIMQPYITINYIIKY